MKKVKITLIMITTLFICFWAILFYLVNKPQNLDKKITLIKVIKLPDLAISTEANYIRHRSLSTIFDIYKDDPDIRVYFPSTFTINEGLYEK